MNSDRFQDKILMESIPTSTTQEMTASSIELARAVADYGALVTIAGVFMLLVLILFLIFFFLFLRILSFELDCKKEKIPSVLFFVGIAELYFRDWWNIKLVPTDKT